MCTEVPSWCYFQPCFCCSKIWDKVVNRWEFWCLQRTPVSEDIKSQPLVYDTALLPFTHIVHRRFDRKISCLSTIKFINENYTHWHEPGNISYLLNIYLHEVLGFAPTIIITTSFFKYLSTVGRITPENYSTLDYCVKNKLNKLMWQWQFTQVKLTDVAVAIYS